MMCAIASVSEIWNGTLSGSLGATVFVILTSTSRSRSARRPSIWSVTVTSRAGCMGGRGPLWTHSCLYLCSATGIGACHGVLRGCGVGCVVRMAMDRECVLFLFPALARTLGSCALHCRRFACAAWRAEQKPFPPAQDPTWRCNCCVFLSN